MKYLVSVGRHRYAVEVGADGVSVDGVPVGAVLEFSAGGPVAQLRMDGRIARVALERVRGVEGAWRVQVGGREVEVTVIDERVGGAVERSGVGRLGSHGAVVRAPMPGLVLAVDVEVGERVGAGRGLVVLEAMKMENEIRAPIAGIVKAVHVRGGEAVEKGAALIELGEA